MPGRFPWRSPMTSARSPKPALRSASSVSIATSRSPKSPNVNTRMSKFSNMSAVSGDSSTVSLGLKFVFVGGMMSYDFWRLLDAEHSMRLFALCPTFKIGTS